MKKAHFIGIGGIGMSALARILKQRGCQVSGTDCKQSPLTQSLVDEGVQVFLEQDHQVFPEDATIIYSTAIAKDHPEWLKAKASGATMLHRSELLKQLMHQHHILAIAGTHGKTTTAALLTWVLQFAGLDPSYAVGGLLKGQNGAHGTGPHFVAECCESDGSLLNYHPDAAIITSTDPDHLDYWKTPAALEAAYQTFAKRAKVLIWCKDTTHFERGVSYGFTAGADVQLSRYQQQGSYALVDITFGGQTFSKVRIAAIGQHNVLNAAAVFALCHELGVSQDLILGGLQSFPGIARRQEIIGEKQSVLIIDDYAHHPFEIQATLQALKAAYPERRLVALFQPHRYSRLQAFFDDFARCFTAADQVLITDVYAAGETSGPSAIELAEKAQALYIADLAAVKDHLRPFDVLVTLGAGDITTFGRELIKDLEVKKLNIALLFGGKSVEHDIAIKSASCIAEAIDSSICNVKRFYIGKNGTLDPKELVDLQTCDLAFPVFHGPNGEDGLFAGLLEAIGLPFVGCDYRSSAVCMDKVWSKQIASFEGIPTAPFTHFFAHEWHADPAAIFERIEKLQFPIWIKAAHLGSSIGAYQIQTLDEVPNVILQALKDDERFIIEEHIPSRDLEVAVLGNKQLLVSHPGEILIGENVYDYAKKYDPATPVSSHAQVPAEIAKAAKELSSKCYRLFGCSGWCRIDFLYSEQRGLFFSEANPIPGCTPTSLYPKLCAEMGLTYPQFIKRLIALGLCRSYAAV